MSYTQLQLDETIKCSNDPKYFMETYCKINTPWQTNAPVKLNDYQRVMLVAIENNEEYNHWLPRQSGKTTFLMMYALWVSIFQPHKTTFIASHNMAAARDICTRLSDMITALPEWLRPQIVRSNTTQIDFDNHSSITFSSYGSMMYRGRTINVLLLDESQFANQSAVTMFIQSVKPSMSAGNYSKVCSISTPYFPIEVEITHDNN